MTGSHEVRGSIPLSSTNSYRQVSRDEDGASMTPLPLLPEKGCNRGIFRESRLTLPGVSA